VNRRELFAKVGAVAAAGTTAKVKSKTFIDNEGIERCWHCFTHGRLTCDCGSLFAIRRPKATVSADFQTASKPQGKSVIDIMPGWFIK
jgi:hypothetical protein